MIVSTRPESCPICRSSHAPVMNLESNQARWAPPVYTPRHGLLFWPTRKVATTSLTFWLMDAGWERLDPREKLPLLAETSDMFVVVREPVDRYISALWWIWSQGYCGTSNWEEAVDGVAMYMAIDGDVYTCDRDEHFTGQWRTLERAGDGAQWFRFDELDKIRTWVAQRGVPIAPQIPHLLLGPDRVSRAYALDRLDHDVIRCHYAADVLAWEMACE